MLFRKLLKHGHYYDFYQIKRKNDKIHLLVIRQTTRIKEKVIIDFDKLDEYMTEKDGIFRSMFTDEW